MFVFFCQVEPCEFRVYRVQKPYSGIMPEPWTNTQTNNPVGHHDGNRAVIIWLSNVMNAAVFGSIQIRLIWIFLVFHCVVGHTFYCIYLLKRIFFVFPFLLTWRASQRRQTPILLHIHGSQSIHAKEPCSMTAEPCISPTSLCGSFTISQVQWCFVSFQYLHIQTHIYMCVYI